MPRGRSPTRKRYSRSRSFSPRRRSSGGRSRRSRSHSPRSRKPARKSPRRHSDHKSRKSRSPQRRRSRSQSRTPRRKHSRSRSRSSSHSPRRKRNSHRDKRENYARSHSPAKEKFQSTREEHTQRPVDRFQPDERPRTPVDVRLNRLTGTNPEPDDEGLYTEGESIHQLVNQDIIGGITQLDNYGIGELDYDEEPARNTPPPPIYHHREEEMLLSQRFRDPQQPRNTGGFKFDENITVDIRRKVKDTSPEEIKRDFDPMSVLKCIHYRKGEGEKPIFDRDDIKLARFELEHQADEAAERRVVSMVSNKSREDFAVSREHISEPTVSTRLLGDRWGSHIAQTMMSSQQQVYVEPVVHRITDNLRFENLDSMYSGPSATQRPENPNDLRNALLRRRQTSDRDRSPVFDARQKISSSTHRDSQGQGRSYTSNHDRDRKSSRDTSGHRSSRHSELDKTRSQGRSTGDRSRERLGSSKDRKDSSHNSRGERGRDRDSKTDIQSRMLSIAGQDRASKTKEGTPDFSRRPDKGRYEAWKEDPTQTPIGSYFEHDNRDGKGPAFGRGRGRGRGFVPRGRGRGFSSRGGGFSSRGRSSFDSRRDSRDNRGDYRDKKDYRSRSSRGEPEWKHDKFKELLDEEDRQPHSTTKSE